MRIGAEILPGQLYQRGLFDHWTRAQKVRLLNEGRIGAMACLVKRYDQDMAELLGSQYIYRPISDGKVIDPIMPLLAFDLAQGIRYGWAVLVQCRAGRNRSGLLAALVVREMTGCSGSEALEHVQRARPNALANEHFCAYLRSLEAP